MYSLMSIRTMACFVVEEELGEGACSFGFADAGGAKEDEGADGPFGVGQAGAAERRMALATAVDGFGLADDALLQPAFHLR